MEGSSKPWSGYIRECLAGLLVLRLGAGLRACLVKRLLLHKCVGNDALQPGDVATANSLNVTVYDPITASTGDTRGVSNDDDDYIQNTA